MKIILNCGDNRNILKDLPENSIDSIVTDPPYGLKFMSKKWDYQVPSVTLWQEVLRVLKPGGHALIFGGSRTYHRLVVNVEDAGFEVRDQIFWVYGSGFPKGKSQLKPAHEPILLARKKPEGSLKANSEKWGVGFLEIDECRISGEMGKDRSLSKPRRNDNKIFGKANTKINPQSSLGRWPANLIHDNSEEILELFPKDSKGSAARFFYSAKCSKKDRNEGLENFPDKIGGGLQGTQDGSMLTGSGNERNNVMKNNHPTVKPTNLMRYLCKLVTPKGGVILDPFLGSGSTGKAAILEGFNFHGMEIDENYFRIAEGRIKAVYKNE